MGFHTTFIKTFNCVLFKRTHLCSGLDLEKGHSLVVVLFFLDLLNSKTVKELKTFPDNVYVGLIKLQI